MVDKSINGQPLPGLAWRVVGVWGTVEPNSLWVGVVGIHGPRCHRFALSDPSLLTAMFAGQATINAEIVEVGRSGVAEYADIDKPLNALQGNLARLRASSLLLTI